MPQNKKCDECAVNAKKSANVKDKLFFAKTKQLFLDKLDLLYETLEVKKKLLVFLASWSAILNYFLEASLRKNLILGFVHIVTQPLTFVYNTLLLFCIFSIMLFLKRRLFYFTVISVTAIAVATTNYIVLLSRNTPLNAPDFRIIKSAFGVVKIYLNLFEQIFVVFLILLGIFLLSAAYIKGKKSVRNMKFSGCAFGIIAAITLTITAVLSSTVTASHFSDLPTAYKEYGFTYSFLCSILDRGIDKPENYSDEAVQTLSNNLELNEQDELSAENPDAVLPSEATPNIIFLQLESFYDPQNVEGLAFNRDPVPVFRSLKERYMSGKFTVPSIGAGTANTEFEVITGMDIDYFGVAEYPYLSVLQDNTCESVAYNLKEYGYSAHAIHNHTGSFYDRHIVFPNLGFDTFTAIENMHQIVRNENGWAKDSMLINEIREVLESTPSQADVIYAVSVQPHGKYPAEQEDYDRIYNESNPPHIIVHGNENDAQKPGVDYWVNQVHEVDSFLGSLINKMSSYNEPTLIVMYGDHLPAFDLENWSVKEGNLYQTEYVIWNNFGLENKGEKELHSYEISSYVMEMLGFDSGYVNKLHQEYRGSDTDYSEKLHLLQYDILYGDKKIFEGSNRYIATNIRYGHEQVKINEVSVFEDTMFVYGENFNEYSVVYINGNKKYTEYINENCVSARNVKLNEGDYIKVVQVTTDLVQLGESSVYEYKNQTT